MVTTIGKRVGLVARWGLVLGVAVGLVALPRTGLAARSTTMVFPPSGARPAPDVALEVKVAPAIAEAANLQRWVSEEGRRVLDGLPKEPRRRGSLRVEIGGALYEYRVVITAMRGGAVVGAPSTWKCECSNEELLEKLRGEVAAGAGGLVGRQQAAPDLAPSKAVAPPVVPEEKDRERKRERLGAVGAAGVALMTFGVAGVATGVGFIVLNAKPPTETWLSREYRDLRPPGTLITGASAGLLITGVALYLLRDRPGRPRQATRASLAPSVARSGNFELVVSGRF